MRALKIVLAVGWVALSACGGGGQPLLYIVAINQSALDALPASCYRSGSAPTDVVTHTHSVVIREWTLWTGIGDVQYLDIGTNAWTLGNANAVSTNSGTNPLSSVIEGSGKSFFVSRQTTKTALSETDLRAITIAFDEVPGATMKGTLNVESTYTCSGCGQPSCSAALPVAGRRVDSQPVVLYGL